MIILRHLILATALVAAVPVTSGAAPAQWPWSAPRPNQPYAYSTGFDRGERAGVEDSRRREAFKFTDESDYRRADAGYRGDYGNRDRYRDEFRRGFEAGYRTGYTRDAGRGRQGRGSPPPQSNGRGGRGVGRYDLAAQNGYSDGYDAGLKEGQSRRPPNAVSQGRYRSADHGYERAYGSKDVYKINYRDAFRVGYEEGYNDGRRYAGR